jgi:hypothetical protein
MANAFEVTPYSIDALKRLLRRSTKASALVVGRKQHTAYFRNYFKALKAKTIVSESDYIDRDYLEDFAGYYVRCFPNYARRCRRLHFFDFKFSQAGFARVLASPADAKRLARFQAGYLGFIVVKPLPETIFGRTCLRTYIEEDERSFPITRHYDANLFGIQLSVKSLAYQEQDRVAAACATSALWSVFHGTGKLFHHPIPSPVEITRAANIFVPSSSRSLPSSGLTVFQMAQAMRSVSLEPYYVKASDEYVLKSTLYAYLRGRVPVLLGIDLYEMRENKAQFDGKHAVTATGFRLQRPKPEPHGDTGFLLRASRMNKLYAHDDQVGPFARMVLDGTQITITTGTKPPSKHASMTTSWVPRIGDSVRAVPDIMLVPLYHKIRIPFDRVHDAVVRFDSFVEELRKHAPDALRDRFEWDIFLTSGNELKSEILKSDSMKGEEKEQVLSQPMPRFIWRAAGRFGEELVLDLLFDATDIEQGDFFVRAIEYDSGVSKFFRLIARERSLLRLFDLGGESRIFNWFAKQPA